MKSKKMNNDTDKVYWELWRQDDHGNKVLIEIFTSEEAAYSAQKEFEERKHKQTYWIEERKSEVK